MFINGDGNWVLLVKGAVVTYGNNNRTTTNMTPVDVSNHPEKVRYSFSFRNNKPKLKVGDKRNISSNGYTNNWNTALFRTHQSLKTKPSINRVTDIDVKIIKANTMNKVYQQVRPANYS